jgi:hypothetical protein
VKTIDLSARKVDLAGILRLAEKGPVLLTSEGQEFLVSKADDFAAEVQALRQSVRFQAFLDKRLSGAGWIPLAQIEKEIAADLAKEKNRSPRRKKGAG